MTPKQRLAFIILQLNYGYTSWNGALRLARTAATGSNSPEAIDAANAVRASLQAAEAAIASMAQKNERELVFA